MATEYTCHGEALRGNRLMRLRKSRKRLAMLCYYCTICYCSHWSHFLDFYLGGGGCPFLPLAVTSHTSHRFLNLLEVSAIPLS